MAITLFNTLTRKKEALNTAHKQTVALYVCGITPYDKVHVGHARCYVTFDVLHRYLAYQGYHVTHVQNYTDIDDKIIDRARELNISISELTEKNISDYERCMDALNIQQADEYPRVTGEIKTILDLIGRLVAHKHAYVAGGNVFYDVRSFPGYGKLSHRNIDDLKTVPRVDAHEQKRDPLDFSLWKAAKEGEPSWDSPWGKGRPGWHIECSAMSQKYLGDTLDIHGGGQDLIFPHHENEIAQSEGATGKPFVRVWMHNGFVTINARKMSKSLGNFFTLDDVFKKFDPMVLRLFLLSQHYRSPLDFSDTKLEEFKRSLAHITGSLQRIEKILKGKVAGKPSMAGRKAIESLSGKFFNAMDDDLNTAQALGFVFNMINYLNEQVGKKTVDHGSLDFGYEKLVDLLRNVLGLKVESSTMAEGDEEKIEELFQQRVKARQEKNWKKSDTLRDDLAKRGVTVEDTPVGSRWFLKTLVKDQS